MRAGRWRAALPVYKFLHLEANQLSSWEELEAPGYVAAVMEAARRNAPGSITEVWLEEKRLATIGGPPGQRDSLARAF